MLIVKKLVVIIMAVALVVTAGFALVACGGEETTTTAAPTTTEAAMMDIVDTAVAAGSFTTLTSLLETAGFVDDSQRTRLHCICAHEPLQGSQRNTGCSRCRSYGSLTDVLTYHVVPGKVMAADVTDGLEATVQGATVVHGTDDGSVMINDANIVQTDIVCSNGVIHVIDAVLLPPSM